MRLVVVVSISILLLFLVASLCVAGVEWPADGVVVCNAGNDQYTVEIVGDGAGGTIMTWTDLRTGNMDIYAQRLDSSGNPLWTADGIVICDAAAVQSFPKIITDGAGGAIIAWDDWRFGNSDIYAQRVNPGGAVLWTANGVAVCNVAGDQMFPDVTTDGSGGAIVTWLDERVGGRDIYAQRVNPGGAVLWTANGVVVCNAAGDKWNPVITTGSSGGAVIAWEDQRSGAANANIYAQGVDSGGTPEWTANGVAVCTAANAQWWPQIATDGAGGAIITWDDQRSGAANADIYAQGVDSGGTPKWTTDGVAICTATGIQRDPLITTDGSGGAILTWNDERSGTWNVYAQRVDAGGYIRWDANGIAICDAAGSRNAARVATDGSGGAIMSFNDQRSGNSDIYAQRVDQNGNLLWATGGLPICTASGDQWGSQVAADGNGVTVIAWEDQRSGNWDIYAQKVFDSTQTWYLAEGSTGEGAWGYFETWVLVQNPGDGVAEVDLFYQTPFGEKAGPHLSLDPGTRTTVNVADTVAGVDSVSTRVVSDNPVIAERSMYWNDVVGGVYRQCAHDSIGVTAPAREWYLAEGSTGIELEGCFETWVLVQNPGGATAEVDLFYQTPGGEIQGPHLSLAPGTRQSVDVAASLPNEFNVSTRVVSDTPVVVERSMYWTWYPGGHVEYQVYRQAAHDSIGVTAPAREWYLAEGSTVGEPGQTSFFETWVLIQNPGGEKATVDITYMTPSGEVPGPQLELDPSTRQSVNVGDTVPNQWSVSTRVTSDKPVIAERAMYWYTPFSKVRQAAHDSIGAYSD